MLAAVGLLLRLCYDLAFPEKRSLSDVLRQALHGFLLLWIGVVISHQLALFAEIRAQKLEEYDRAALLYSEECPYTRSSPARLKECSDLKIIINTWPTTRALSQLVKGWNSGWQETVRQVTNDLSYKVAFALIALAITSYVFNLFNCFKRKSKEWTDKYRYRETNKDAIASLNKFMQEQHQQHSVQ